MLATFADHVLLAQESRWESLARGFRAQPADPQQLLWFLATIGVLIALLALLAHWSNRQSGRSYFGPRRLFWTLCRAHRLSIADCWWLWLLSRGRRLRDPARLFLEAELLDPSDLPAKFRVQAARFEGLRKRLFVWEEPPASKRRARLLREQAERPPGPGPLPPPVPPPRLELADEWLSDGFKLPAD